MKVHYFPVRASQNLPAVYICTVNCKRLAALSLRGDTKIASAFVCDPEMHCGDRMAQFKQHLVVEEGVEFPGDLSEYDQMRLDLIGCVSSTTTKTAPTGFVMPTRRFVTKKAWHRNDWKDDAAHTPYKQNLATGHVRPVNSSGATTGVVSKEEPGTDVIDTETDNVPVDNYRKML